MVDDSAEDTTNIPAYTSETVTEDHEAFLKTPRPMSTSGSDMWSPGIVGTASAVPVSLSKPEDARQVQIQRVRTSISEMSDLLNEMKEMRQRRQQILVSSSQSTGAESDLSRTREDIGASSHFPETLRVDRSENTESAEETTAERRAKEDTFSEIQAGPRTSSTRWRRQSAFGGELVLEEGAGHHGVREETSQEKHTSSYLDDHIYETDATENREPSMLAELDRSTSEPPLSEADIYFPDQQEAGRVNRSEVSRKLPDLPREFTYKSHDTPTTGSRPSKEQDEPQGHSQGHRRIFSEPNRHSHHRSTSGRRHSHRSDRRRNFAKESVESLLAKRDSTYDLNDIRIPSPERRLLEKFIDALSKLSIEVELDEGKRAEGRRRLNNALRALEGWI